MAQEHSKAEAADPLAQCRGAWANERAYLIIECPISQWECVPKQGEWRSLASLNQAISSQEKRNR